ncbi:hypothetical protein FNZ18_20340 [Salmonella enterica subsp. salamae]|nr:hypothetical protein [Salmonella enterica subsp. salamae]
MHTIPYYSNNTSVPVWVTVDEAVDIINRRENGQTKKSDLWRYALYGHLPLSIYFQSPIKLRKVCTNGDNILLDTVNGSIIDEIAKLSDSCILHGENRIIRTEGEYISPQHHIIDTPLLGLEYMILQKHLASTLNIPEPVKGQYNSHYGVLVHEEGMLYQIFESTTWENRVEQRLKNLPANMACKIYQKIEKTSFSNSGIHDFPLYQFPADAWFVIKRTALEKFMNIFFPTHINDITKTSHRISTPLSRLLWLACKHNPDISPLIGQPYKLISVFEEWASSDGITERLNGDTLKTALQRGSPFPASISQ